MRIPIAWLYLGISYLCVAGCAQDRRGQDLRLREMLSAIPHLTGGVDWVLERIERYDGDRLISIYTDPEFDGTTLRIRFVDDGVTVCDEAIRDGPNIRDRQVYRVPEPAAWVMVDDLCRQASRVAPRSFKEPSAASTNPGRSYVISIGKYYGSVDDNSEYLDDLVTFIVSRTEQLATSKNDRDFAMQIISRRPFQSCGAYVIFGVKYCDAICELASER